MSKQRIDDHRADLTELPPPVAKKKKKEEFGTSTIGVIPSVCLPATPTSEEYYHKIMPLSLPKEALTTAPVFSHIPGHQWWGGAYDEQWVVLQNVFCHLSFEDMMCAGMTCRLWYHVMFSEQVVQCQMERQFPDPSVRAPLYPFFRAGIRSSSIKKDVDLTPTFVSRVLTSLMAYNRISVILQEEEMRRLSNTMSITVGGQSSVVDQQKLVKSVRRYNHAKTAEASYKVKVISDTINSILAVLPFECCTLRIHSDVSPMDIIKFIIEMACVRSEAVCSRVSGMFGQVRDLCIIDVHKDAPREYKPLFDCNPWDGTLYIDTSDTPCIEKKLMYFVTVADKFLRVLPRGTKFPAKEKAVMKTLGMKSLTYDFCQTNASGQLYFLGSLMIADNRKVANMVRGFDVAVTIKQEIKVAIAQLQLTIPWNAFLNDDYMDFKSIDSSKY
jgi:hypothetical protein